MLPARSRVRRSPEFAAAVRRGRRGGSRSLVVHVLAPAAPRAGSPVDEAGRPRAGFVVGRTVGPAVVRNRVRRRLRHLVAERLAELPDGTLLVVRALPASAARGWSELAADLDRALARASVPSSARG